MRILKSTIESGCKIIFPSKDQKMKTQEGFIGFFDILGYQSLLENNDAEMITETVLPILENLDSLVPATMKKIFYNKIVQVLEKKPSEKVTVKRVEDSVNTLIEEIEFLVFSDTILLSIPVDNKIKDYTILTAVFFSTCTYLLKSMFDLGLPLRGGIDFGKYSIAKSCFVGKPIVESYKISNDIELAACVLSDKLKKAIDKGHEEFLSLGYLLDYLIPTKNGEKKCYTLSYMPTFDDRKDMKDTVLSSFWKHNKTIPLSVQNKVKNTEQYFRFIKNNNPILPRK